MRCFYIFAAAPLSYPSTCFFKFTLKRIFFFRDFIISEVFAALHVNFHISENFSDSKYRIISAYMDTSIPGHYQSTAECSSWKPLFFTKAK